VPVKKEEQHQEEQNRTSLCLCGKKEKRRLIDSNYPHYLTDREPRLG